MARTGLNILKRIQIKMASLEDTFRMMKGEEPVNTNRLTDEDKNFNETRPKFQDDGGKITKDFMECVRGTLIENRGGVRPQRPDIKDTQIDLVSKGKVLVALLNSIKEDRLDERVLMHVSDDMDKLKEHLSVYPEFDSIIKNRMK